VRDKLTKYIENIADSYIDFKCTIPDLQNMDIIELWEGTNQMMKESIQRISNYIAIRNVFFELKSIIHDLYLPKVTSYNLRSIMNENLKSFIQATRYLVPDEAIATYIILNTFKNLVLYISILILDGGNERTFEISDSLELLYDIHELEDLFFDNSPISSKRFILKCTNRLKS
jgi:hypothetical protein